MARRKTTTPDLTGSSIEELMNLDNLYQLDTASSKAVLNRLISAANKRIRRLVKLDVPSPAVIKRQVKVSRTNDNNGLGRGRTNRLGLIRVRTGRKNTYVKLFSSRGAKKINEVRAQIRHVQKFLKSDTSTVHGYRKYRKGIIDKMGREFKNKQEEKRFWKVYEKLLETRGGEITQVFSSDQVQKWLLEESGGKRMNRQDLYDLIDKRLDKEYYDLVSKQVEEFDEKYGDIDDEEEEDNPFTEDDLPF